MPILELTEDGRYMLGMPVESSFLSFSVEFEVTQDEASALMREQHRLRLLYGVVFLDAQTRHTSRTLPVPPEALRLYAHTLLLGSEADCVSLLDQFEVAHQRLRYLVKILTDPHVDVSTTWFPNP